MNATRPAVLNSETLRESRRVLRFSQERMAEALFTDQASISRWENGKANPYSWKAIERLLELVEAEEKVKSPAD